MNSTRGILGVIALLGAAASIADPPQTQSFLCIGEHATGFTMDKKSRKWAATQFNTRRYIVKTPGKGPNAPSGAFTSAMAVYEFGQDDGAPTALCEKPFNQVGALFCSGEEDFNFNRKTLRFMHSFVHGYIEPPGGWFGPEGSAEPLIEIGTCSAI